jgi:hypothetical protein
LKDSLNSTYHLIKDITDKEYKGFRDKVKQLGGRFIYQNLQNGNAFCVVKNGDAASGFCFLKETSAYLI